VKGTGPGSVRWRLITQRSHVKTTIACQATWQARLPGCLPSRRIPERPLQKSFYTSKGFAGIKKKPVALDKTISSGEAHETLKAGKRISDPLPPQASSLGEANHLHRSHNQALASDCFASLAIHGYPVPTHLVHGAARPAPGYAGGPQASSLLRSNVDALGLSPSAAGRPRAPDVDAPPTPRTWAPRHHHHALACLDDLQQGILQSRPITAIGTLDVERGCAVAPPRSVLSNDTHTRPDGRGISRSDAALTRQAITSKGAVTPVTAPDSRDRGPRFSPVIYT